MDKQNVIILPKNPKSGDVFIVKGSENTVLQQHNNTIKPSKVDKPKKPIFKDMVYMGEEIGWVFK